ncbi:nucleoside ABC transporter membrane protein [Alkalispirochaeta americana]|uniref:Nucleoside ABC transporter membrane protein n=1 Tax=Alkalispirochaeta americana TaxID=159291 RepID=A0A1N6PRG8_9SPIO|nr:ABC transporter permease [Alkalispirochaeta americana]SIQ06897.1 nucleoside ABC transporter membrane protein [Alkalispirochaeta americana]
MTGAAGASRRGPFLAAAAAVATVLVVILLSSPHPLRTITTFLTGPWSNSYALGNTLARASLLTLTGTGVIWAFRAGVFNLGGEGQTYLGAIVLTAVLTTSPLAGYAENPGLAAGAVALAGVAIAAMAAGTMAGLSGWLRHLTGADELITTFLLAAAVLPVGDYLILGPLRDQTSNLLATPFVPASVRLARFLPPSTLNSSLIWALLAAATLTVVLRWTLFGYEMRITAYNRELARYAGIPVGRYTVIPLAISGALHGIAGSALVLGVHGRSITGFSGNLGWNGIAVALIARNNPLLVVPAALFFAFLDGGARAAVLQDQTTWELGSLIQGVIFLFVTARIAGFPRVRQNREAS